MNTAANPGNTFKILFLVGLGNRWQPTRQCVPAMSTGSTYREYNPDSAGTRRDECLVETHLDRSLVGEQRVNSWWEDKAGRL